jgi:hypothetical protein
MKTLNPNTIDAKIKQTEFKELMDAEVHETELTVREMSAMVEAALVRIPMPQLVMRNGRILSGGRPVKALQAFAHNEFALEGCRFVPFLDGKRFNDLPGMGGQLQPRLRATTFPVVSIDGAEEVANAVEELSALLLG